MCAVFIFHATFVAVRAPIPSRSRAAQPLHNKDLHLSQYRKSLLEDSRRQSM